MNLTRTFIKIASGRDSNILSLIETVGPATVIVRMRRQGEVFMIKLEVIGGEAVHLIGTGERYVSSGTE